MAAIKTFQNVVHPVHIDLGKVTGFTRNGSQLFVNDGGVQPIVVSFKTLEDAEKAEKEFLNDLQAKQ